MTYKVLVADPLSKEGLLPLKQAKNIEVVIKTNLPEEKLINIIGEYDALLVRSQTTVTKKVIANGHRLKVIGRAGVGVDNIDIDAATERGVVVVNAPDGNINSAAEHTMAMLMAIARKIPQAFLALKEKRWDRNYYVGVELKGKTLGIIGLGRVGAEVAYRAKGQRMKVVAYDPFLTEKKAENMGITAGTFEGIIRVADFITIHTPLLKETKHMINKKAFQMMKENVQIINCARGGIIDESALYEAVVSKQIAGAAIDVFEQEPAIDNKLLDLPEVIATPHLGASTIEAQENVAIDVSEDVVTVLNGGLAQNPLNIPSVPEDVMRKIKPYFYLAEKLGTFVSRLEEEVVEEFNVYYAGELTKLDVAPITRNAIKGFLKYHLGKRVNEVNAGFLAKQKGITIYENKTSSARGFTDLLTVEIRTKSRSRSVVGTLLNGLGPRIVKVDSYSMDVVPEGHLVMINHTDQPGAIGKVGTFLAKNDINIATMQVGRVHIGGEAIMMLTIDKPLERARLQQIKNIPDIFDVTAIDL